MRRVALVATVALATLLVAVLLWQFRGAAALFLVSLVTAAALHPFVDGLETRGINRKLALAIVYAVALVVVAAFAYLVGRALMDELERGARLLGGAYERWRARAAGWHPVPDLLLRRLPPAAALGGAIAAGRPEALARELLGVTLNLFDVVGRFVIVVALSAYWSASRSSFERLWLSFVPATRRGRARDIWRHVDAGVGAHVRSEIGQSLATVLVLAGLFQYVGLPVPVLTALGAGLFRLVPLVGLFFAVLMAFLAGAAVDLPLGVVAAAATATVIVLLDQLVARRLCQTRPFSGTLVVLMVVALTDAYGILGLALAAPLAAAVQILLERLLATQPTRSRRVLRLSDMEQRLSRLRRLMARSATPGSSEVASLVGRLEHVVGEAREIPELTPQPEVGQGGAAWELSPSTPMIREPPRGR